MKGIAVTVGTGGRRDFFRLNRRFSMVGSTAGMSAVAQFGGTFTSVPTAVSSMVRPDSVAVERLAGAAGQAEGGGEAGASADTDLEAGRTHDGSEPATGAADDASRGLGLDDVWGGILVRRTDLFGLGLDYAMYHKSVWGRPGEDNLLPWHRLGGVFTSAVAAIAWADDRVDVFGVGMDHALYAKTRLGNAWTPHWRRLGGRFTSAASLVSRGSSQLDVFVRGADYTLRRNQSDGESWFGWQNHGGSLASPPVAVSWGPDRLDIFAIFRDGALWHRWWDGQLWNEWESLGGRYTGEPAVVSARVGRIDVVAIDAGSRGLRHHWFSNDNWSGPDRPTTDMPHSVAEAPTLVADGPDRLEMFVPMDDGQIHVGNWDGQTWRFAFAGGGFRMPSRYRLSVDHVVVHTPRAPISDTVAAAASLAIGNAAVATKTQWLGETGSWLGRDSAQTNLLDFESVSVDLAEPMSFGYIFVNNGHADEDKILASLAGAGDSLGLAGSSSMQEDIARGVARILAVKIAATLSLSLPVVGSILAAIEKWLLGRLIDALFADCDGIVAVELRAMMGRDLFIQTDNGRKTATITTQHVGPEAGCGDRSEYDVTWSITPL